MKEIVESLSNAPWSGDPFQTPMVINTLCSLKAIDCDNKKFTEATESLLNQRKYKICISFEIDHFYLYQYFVPVLNYRLLAQLLQ